jgi:hypothetical protein
VLLVARESDKQVAPKSASAFSPKCKDVRALFTFKACESAIAPGGPMLFSSMSNTAKVFDTFSKFAMQVAPASNISFDDMSSLVTVVFDFKASAMAADPLGPIPLQFKRMLDKFSFGRLSASASAVAPDKKTNLIMNRVTLKSNLDPEINQELLAVYSNVTNPI